MQKFPLTRFLIAFASLVIILAGVKLAGEIVIPFLLSLFIAIICSPAIRFMTKRKIPLGLAITLMLIFIVVLFLFLAGMINSTIREFTASIPQYKEILQIRLETLKTFITEWNIPLTIPDVSALESFDPSMVMQLVSRVLLSFSNVVSNVFMLLLVVVFMLLESPVIKYKITLAFNGGKSNFNQEVEHLSRVVESIIRYLGVKTLMSALTGIWRTLGGISFLTKLYSQYWLGIGWYPNCPSSFAAQRFFRWYCGNDWCHRNQYVGGEYFRTKNDGENTRTFYISCHAFIAFLGLVAWHRGNATFCSSHYGIKNCIRI